MSHLSPATDEPEWVPGGTGEYPRASLHSPAKALIKSWNQRASEALNRIAPVRSLLTIHTHPTLWFIEELWVLKRVKTHLDKG